MDADQENLRIARKICLQICVSAVIIFLFAFSVFAQRGSQGWTWQNPLPQGNPLYSIHFAPDKETGFAVGSDATILKTTDGGFSWKRQFSPAEAPLSSVFVRDKNNAFAVGARSTLLATTNGGKDWKQVAVDARDHFYGVKFSGTGLNTGWIIGSYGRILKTSDGGLTWKTQLSGTQEQLLNIDAFDETYAVATGVGGVVLSTDNGGESWKQSDPCAGAVVSEAAYLSQTTIVAAGFGGCVARSEDAGQTWSRVNIFSRADMLSVTFSDASSGSMTDANGSAPFR